jgi:hypothetical protein
MEGARAPQPALASPWTFRLLVLVSVSFVLAGIAVAVLLPDPAR